jgi:CubicO group peptidase (beta-lactamase class C family)
MKTLSMITVAIALLTSPVGFSQQPDSIRHWTEALGDSDAFAVGDAIRALARQGSTAIPALSKKLESPDQKVRFAAAVSLYRMGAVAAPAASTVAGLLGDSSANVRWVAASTLGNLGRSSHSAITALQDRLADQDADVRAAAASALRRIAPDLPETDLNAAVTNIEQLVPVLMAEHHVAGVAVALVEHGRVAWRKEFGVSDIRTGMPVDSSTLFEACSMSKPIFAYIAMKLVEEGKLSLDAPLSMYLKSKPVDPDLLPITTRMALSHTSGLPNWRKGDDEYDGPLSVKFKQGSKFSYSGEGIFYLQRVVEEISGEPLDALSQRMLFQPLGLRNCSYVSTALLQPRIASGHDEQGKFRMKTSYTHPNAAYTMYVSAGDYARLLLLMMNRLGANFVLSRALVDTMLTPQVQLDAREPIERPGRAHDAVVYWGLGWSLNATAAGLIAHHGGSNGSGFRCFSQFNPTRGTGIVIMTNGAGGTELWTRVISRVGDF